MKVLDSILQEELSRLKELKQNYKNEISKLPKGSLIKKNIKGQIYYYLNYRDKMKKQFKYLGKLNKKELEIWEKQINERRNLWKLLIQIKKDIKKLERIVGGKSK
jgi:hypothetical protein